MAKKTAPAGKGGAAVTDRLHRQNDRRDTQINGDWQGQPIDPRLVFLERAEARLYLVHSGFMSLGEAVASLINSLEAMAPFIDDVPLSPGGAP